MKNYVIVNLEENATRSLYPLPHEKQNPIIVERSLWVEWMKTNKPRKVRMSQKIKTIYENGEQVASWVVTHADTGEQLETFNAKTAQELLNTGLFKVLTIKEHLHEINNQKTLDEIK